MTRHHSERFTEDPDRYVDAPEAEAVEAEPNDSERDPELRELTDDELLVRMAAFLSETEPLHGLATTVGTVAAAETAASGYRTLEYAERAGREAELERVREWLERHGVGRPKRSAEDETDTGQVDTAQAAR